MLCFPSLTEHCMWTQTLSFDLILPENLLQHDWFAPLWKTLNVTSEWVLEQLHVFCHLQSFHQLTSLFFIYLWEAVIFFMFGGL